MREGGGGGGAYTVGPRGTTRRVTSQGEGELGVASDDGGGAGRMPSTLVESQRAVKSEQSRQRGSRQVVGMKHGQSNMNLARLPTCAYEETRVTRQAP